MIISCSRLHKKNKQTTKKTKQNTVASGKYSSGTRARASIPLETIFLAFTHGFLYSFKSISLPLYFFAEGGGGYIWKQKSKSKFKTYFRSRQDLNHFLLLEQWVLQTPRKAVKTPAAFASASCFQKDLENIPSCLFSSELYVSYISQVEATQPTSCIREYNENHHNDLWSFYVFWGRLNIIRHACHRYRLL